MYKTDNRQRQDYSGFSNIKNNMSNLFNNERAGIKATQKFTNDRYFKANFFRTLQPKDLNTAEAPQAKPVPSLSEFWNDREFIEFLKNVALFCTKEDSDDESDASSQYKTLYKNLSMLRKKFQDYKRAKKTNCFANENNPTQYSAWETPSNSKRPQAVGHNKSSKALRKLLLNCLRPTLIIVKFLM